MVTLKGIWSNQNRFIVRIWIFIHVHEYVCIFTFIWFTAELLFISVSDTSSSISLSSCTVLSLELASVDAANVDCDATTPAFVKVSKGLLDSLVTVETVVLWTRSYSLSTSIVYLSSIIWIRKNRDFQSKSLKFLTSKL